MRKKHSSQGYITIELLAAAAILLLLVSLSYTPSKAFLKQYHRMQVRIAAQHFATDIRSLQQKALFGNDISDKLVILSNNQGYYWLFTNNNNRTYTYFKNLGCDGVYFKEKLSTIQFSSSGAPSGSSDYVYELKHYEDDNFTCKLILQVASGRLDINEIS